MKRLQYLQRTNGFTLVEMLVSVAVLTILIIVLTSLISGLRLAIAGTTSQVEQFQQARDAFETMTRRIGQATLNAYDDADPKMIGPNAPYVRASELRFISGLANSLIMQGPGITPNTASGPAIYPTDAIFFQAPLGYSLASGTNAGFAGLNSIINTCGYFLHWDSDKLIRPGFLANATVPALRWRMRLMELMEPSDQLTIYKYTSAQPSATGTGAPSVSWFYNTGEWYQQPLTMFNTAAGQVGPPVHAIAENIVFLCFLPMVAPQDAQQPKGGDVDGTSIDLSPDYLYDSSPPLGAISFTSSTMQKQNKLPPMVYVMMIAVDEKSFSQYEATRQGGDPTADPSSDLGIANGGTFLHDASYSGRMGGQGKSGDVVTVVNHLKSHNINYRIFTAAVSLTPN